MDFDTFLAAEQKRIDRTIAAVASANEKFGVEVAKAAAERDAALAKAGAEDLSARDASEKAFNEARAAERTAVVAAANAEAGLDADGAPTKGKGKGNEKTNEKK
jgi:hypothetical protein